MPEAVDDEDEAGSGDAAGDGGIAVAGDAGVTAGDAEAAPSGPRGDGHYPEGVRKLTDPGALRALAHPTRLRLMEMAAISGTLTATAAAETLGGTPAAAAYHLRTLGKHGFLEEAEGGTGRERPWKMAYRGISWDDDAEDPVERATARALSEAAYAGWMRRFEHYHAHHDEYPESVRQLSGASEFVFFATPEEMAQVQSEVWAIYSRFMDRVQDPSLRPAGAPPIEVVTFTFPYTALAPDDGGPEEPEAPAP